MIISKEGNITVITQEKLTLVELAQEIEAKLNEFENYNIIVHLTVLEVFEADELLEFLKFSNQHRGNKHSFVIVTDKVDFDEVPDEIIVVPTLQEAYDIIEMEEMERDLGF